MRTENPDRIEDVLPFMGYCTRNKRGTVPLFRLLGRLGMTTVRLWFFDLVLSVREEVSPSGRILCFKSFDRPDYNELFDNVTQALPDAATVAVNYREVYGNKSPGYSFLPIWRIPQRMIWCLAKSMERKEILKDAFSAYGPGNGLWLFLQFLKMEAAFLPWFTHPPRAVVVFSEMHDPDRVLTWMCAQRGIPCASMQHGVYTEYLREETVNNNNYKPRYVQEVFAWGANTARLFRKYAPHVKITVCGKPTFRVSFTPTVGEPAYRCVVIMDQNLFSEQNRAMLSLVRRAAGGSGKLGVRMHPQNNPDHYDLEGFTLTGDTDWTSAEVYVGHSTTFLFEILQAGSRLYRYNSGAESSMSCSQIEFTSAEELKELLAHPVETPEKLVKEYYDCVGQASVEAHVLAIQQFSESRT